MGKDVSCLRHSTAQSEWFAHGLKSVVTKCVEPNGSKVRLKKLETFENEEA
jgi:hypothetical protein